MMTLNKYNELLTTMPDSLSDEFIPWIKENNVVVNDGLYWLIIENCKYHTEEHPHFTAFLKHPYEEPSEDELGWLYADVVNLDIDTRGWFKYENSTKNKTLKRYHIHLVRDQDHWVEMQYKLLKNHHGESTVN